MNWIRSPKGGNPKRNRRLLGWMILFLDFFRESRVYRKSIKISEHCQEKMNENPRRKVNACRLLNENLPLLPNYKRVHIYSKQTKN